MFYETKNYQHGLPHDPFLSCIVPRPIGWISTMSGDGVVNLAPYSFFNGIAEEPPMVMFASNGTYPKDTIVNCEATGEFVVSVATWDLREEMNRTAEAVSPEIDEMTLAGLERAPSRLVKPPRVKASPINMECVYDRTIDLPCDVPDGRNAVVMGRVVGIHIRDDVLTDGMIEIAKIVPIGRLGYLDYSKIDNVFTMERPNPQVSD